MDTTYIDICIKTFMLCMKIEHAPSRNSTAVRDPLLLNAVTALWARVACHVEITTRRFEIRTHIRVTRSTRRVINTSYVASGDMRISCLTSREASQISAGVIGS